MFRWKWNFIINFSIKYVPQLTYIVYSNFSRFISEFYKQEKKNIHQKHLPIDNLHFQIPNLRRRLRRRLACRPRDLRRRILDGEAQMEDARIPHQFPGWDAAPALHGHGSGGRTHWDILRPKIVHCQAGDQKGRRVRVRYVVAKNGIKSGQNCDGKLNFAKNHAENNRSWIFCSLLERLKSISYEECTESVEYQSFFLVFLFLQT